uniref:Uncharacterized protein n=1 Tax=Tanacetum cinerariifolium TaxID=118510 RepID=A0A6L2N528_TANCI|nr:hypothetical protein [Tanacetum cinerariifolium]
MKCSFNVEFNLFKAIDVSKNMVLGFVLIVGSLLLQLHMRHGVCLVVVVLVAQLLFRVEVVDYFFWRDSVASKPLFAARPPLFPSSLFAVGAAVVGYHQAWRLHATLSEEPKFSTLAERSMKDFNMSPELNFYKQVETKDAAQKRLKSCTAVVFEMAISGRS